MNRRKAEKSLREADLIKRMDAAFKLNDKISVPSDFNARVWEKLDGKKAPLIDRILSSIFIKRLGLAAAALLVVFVIYENIGRSDITKNDLAAAKPAVKPVIAKKEVKEAIKQEIIKETKLPPAVVAAAPSPIEEKKAEAKEGLPARKDAFIKNEALAMAGAGKPGQTGASSSASSSGVSSASMVRTPGPQNKKPPVVTPGMTENYIVMNNIIKPLQQEKIVIKYRIDMGYHVVVTVFDRDGRLIKKLVREEKGPGIYETSWDGRDERGNVAADGIYMIYIKTDLTEDKIKAVVVK